ncbi:MAG: FG-GAP repeat domain-containing protein, partial [Hominenteromicrobium sp.]
MRAVFNKITAFCLAALLAVCLSGCGGFTGLDAQTLMSPPRTTADRQAIYALMRGDGADISLVYPKNGEYRSAIISRDLNADGTAEIVSFCSSGEAGGVRIEFLSKDSGGAWYSLARFTTAANQVDRVLFGDLTGDGTEEIVVGWGDPLTATASVSVYRLAGGAVHEFSMRTVLYSELLLTDFDDDAVQELFVVDAGQSSGGENEVSTPLGSLYRFDGEQPYVSQTVPLDGAVTRYAAASFAQINSWRRAVVLDGYKADGRMVTQVIGYDEVTQLLSSPLSEAGEEGTNPSDRATAVAVTSRDINGDGILEIPTAELVVEADGNGTPDSTNYVVTWNTFSFADCTLTPVCRSILNTTENYLVPLPNGGGYGCTNDPVTRTATFFRYTQKGYGGAFLGQQVIFAITVYS